MNYIKATILLGFLVPLLVFGTLVGAAWYGFSKVGDVYNVRAAAYAQLQSDKAEEGRLREEVLPHKGAIAYFDEMKAESFEEKLPTYVSELFDGEFDGVLIRNSLDFQGDDRVSISLTGRYDAVQKFISRLGARFLFLDTEAVGVTAADPDLNIPSRHLTVSYTAVSTKTSEPEGLSGGEIPVGDDGMGGVQ